MKNPFPDKVRELFLDNYSCWQCGLSKPLEADHILGRISDSPFNLAPLCHECHENKKAHKGEEKFKLLSKYLQKTFFYITEQNFLRVDGGYKKTQKDKEFILRYISFYRHDK